MPVENTTKGGDGARHERLPSDVSLLGNVIVESQPNGRAFPGKPSNDAAAPKKRSRVSSPGERFSVDARQSSSSDGSFGDNLSTAQDRQSFQLHPITISDLERQALPRPEATSQLCSVSDTFLSFPIAGHEAELGSIFNYARIHTHTNAVQHITQAFGQFIAKQIDRVTVGGRSWADVPEDGHENLEGSPEEMSRYISPTGTDLVDLSVHDPASPSTISNATLATILAALLQRGFTGPAILIAYK